MSTYKTRYLHKVIVVIYEQLKVSHGVISSYIVHACCSSSYGDKPSLPVFLAFTARFLWCSFPNQVQLQQKYQLGVWGAPTTTSP